MITELLGLAGSGLIGSVFGIVSDVIQRKQERESAKVQLEIARENRLNGVTAEHTRDFASKPAFGWCFGVLCITYCLCCLLCIIFPESPIHTFNPDDIPKKVSLFWGFFTWEKKINYVYTISTGGVGYALLHPLAFQIGTVITGLKASR